MSRCGFAALLGAPNAGKSTLLNRLTGARLSIVTPKAQTTRARVRGVMMEAGTQVILVDTPGIFRPRRRLDRAMVAAAWGGARDADLALLVLDAAAGLTDAVRAIAGDLAAIGRPAWLVLNKTDRMRRARLLPLIAEAATLAPFAETFPLSAATGEGIPPLRAALAAAMPDGPFLYPPDELSDLPERLFAAELVREQIFLQTQQEIPYAATVETESWTERPDGSVRIDATVYVSRPGHKAILIGAGGARIRAIGAKARVALAEELGRGVHLFLNVKERAGWDSEAARLRAIGLEETG